MKKHGLLQFALTLFLFCSIIPLLISYQRAEAQTAITIQPDGSITPTNAPIATSDKTTYTLTGNFTDNLVVQKNNIIIDGNGYTLNGPSQTTATGILLDTVKNVTIRNMHIKGYYWGIYAIYTNQSTITNNSISSAYGIGTVLSYSNNNTLNNNNFTNNAANGLYISYSSNNLIAQNKIANNVGPALSLYQYATNNTITQNTVTNNTGTGIGISNYCTNNTVIANTVSLNTGTGIYVIGSSTGCTIANNNVTQNQLTGIGTPGFGIEAWDQNTLITGNNITGNAASGIRIAYNKITVTQNTITQNDVGITVAELTLIAQNNTINANNITSNLHYGIYLQGYSTNININANTIQNCSYGLWLDPYANNNTITDNEITQNNILGIGLQTAANNTIYHNSITDNAAGAAVNAANNVWDNGYPSGGNYWSDYNGTDRFSGPNQNVLGADGIGDAPYAIIQNNADRYPIMTVMFNQTGVGTDYTGTMLQIDTKPYTQSQIPTSFMWSRNSTHTYNFQSPLVTASNTKRYIWTNNTGLTNTQNQNTLTVPRYGTITGNYQTQFLANVTAAPAGANGGTIQITYTQMGTTKTAQTKTTPWTDWVDAGTTITVANPQQLIQSSTDPAGTQYLFNNFMPSQTLLVDASKTIALNYTTQYYLTVSSPYSTPTGQGWYNENTTANATLPTNTTPGTTGTQYIFTNWTANASGTDYTRSNPITMDKPKTATANWKTQHQLTITANPTAAGSTNPTATNQWIDAGTLLLNATANSGYKLQQWLSSNPAITFANPTSPNTTATITGPGTITANFTLIPPGITITTSINPGTITADGIQYATPVTFNWTTGTTHTITANSPISGATGTQYVFTDWSDQGTQTHTYTVTATTTTLNANYKTQYQITLTTTPANAGTTNPTATAWTDPGPLQITAAPNSGYQFTQWTNNTNTITILNANTQTTTATINGPGTITATFTTTPTPTPNPTSTPTSTPNPTQTPQPTITPTTAPTPTPTTTPTQTTNPTPQASPTLTPKPNPSNSPTPTPVTELPSSVLLIIGTIAASTIAIALATTSSRKQRQTKKDT